MAAGAKLASRRSALIAVELILMLPILLIFLAAVIEFGLILSMIQSVEAANRYGLRFVSEQANGPSAVALATSGQLRSDINRQLQVAGIQNGICRLVVEHNGANAPNTGTDAPPTGACNCTPPATLLPTPRTAVRLTICVPLEGNIPDLLGGFGFSLAGRTIQKSGTFRIE